MVISLSVFSVICRCGQFLGSRPTSWPESGDTLGEVSARICRSAGPLSPLLKHAPPPLENCVAVETCDFHNI